MSVTQTPLSIHDTHAQTHTETHMTRKEKTYPGYYAQHLHLVHDVEAQEHGVPPHVPQHLHLAQLPGPRGVPHLRGHGAALYAEVDVVRLVRRRRDGPGLCVMLATCQPFPFYGCCEDEIGGSEGTRTSGKEPYLARL